MYIGQNVMILKDQSWGIVHDIDEFEHVEVYVVYKNDYRWVHEDDLLPYGSWRTATEEE